MASEQRLDIKTTFLSQAAALLSPLERQSDRISFVAENGENFLELIRQPREQIIRACDLPSIVANIEGHNLKTAKIEYKWRGHSWMICDMQLLQSFQRPHEEVKLVFKRKILLLYYFKIM